MQTFNLPDVGEGLTEAEIVAWKVARGDTVKLNQVLVEIETAKSLVELPSPYAGTVDALLAAEGETVEVGAPIIRIATGAAEDNQTELPVPGDDVAAATGQTEAQAVAAEVEQGQALVGSGPKADAVKRRARRNRPAAGGKSPKRDAAQKAQATAHLPLQDPTLVTTDERANFVPGRVAALWGKVMAKPPVRRVAKELGINIADVTGTGARGEVTREDVENYLLERDRNLEAAPTFWVPESAGQDQRIERVPVKGVRKATAKAVSDSAFSAPHVSIFVDVDASRTMEFVQRLKESKDFEGIRVTPLLILAKAVIWAAARNPHVNASWTDEEILVKRYMNLGIAAATPRGLLVPNIKNAHKLSLKELAVELNNLARRARDGKTQPAEMSDGTISITNIGALGIDIGTPIINKGEVAIVAFGTIKQKPWVVSGEVIPRWITTLGGSFDHRVVDGDLSARFMADVAAIMEEPALLLE